MTRLATGKCRCMMVNDIKDSYVVNRTMTGLATGTCRCMMVNDIKDKVIEP